MSTGKPTVIRVQPAARLRRAFAEWAVAQRPKVGTVSETAFGVPADLYRDMPEDLLIGAVVDGHRYVPATAVAVPDTGEREEQPQAELPGGAAAGDTAPEDTAPEDAALLDGPPQNQQDEEPDTAPAAPGTGNSSGRVQCPQCDRDFAGDRGLEAHRRRAHRGTAT